MKRRQIILLSFISIVTIMVIGFNQEETLNFTQYYERRRLWLEIAVTVHVATIVLLTIYYYNKKNRNIALSFLICLGFDIVVISVSALIIALNFQGIQHLKF